MECVVFGNKDSEHWVTKKMLYPGCSDDKVSNYSEESKVIFHYQAQLCDYENTVLDDSRKFQPMEIILGKKFKFELWESCLKTMCVKEVACFTATSSYVTQYPEVARSLRAIKLGKPIARTHCCAMSSSLTGHEDLDALVTNPQTLQFVIEVIRVEVGGSFVRENWLLSEDELLAKIDVLRRTGNELYQVKQYEDCCKKYAEALGLIEQLIIKEKPKTERHQNFQNKQLALLLNFSQCKLHLQEYYLAIVHLTQALDIDPDNVKALFRRGKAHIGAWNPQEAKADFERVLLLDHSLVKPVKRELFTLENLEREHNNNQKKSLIGKMFG